MRDYGKVYGTFWSSKTTGDLSDDGKVLALYLMTCSHSTIAGVFRLPDGYVSEDLRWPAERVQQGFAELLTKGFANRCQTTKWVWVIKHLEWNKPENPNQRKSAAKIALGVPDECEWKREFMRDCGEALALPPMPEPDPSSTVPKPLLNQKQELEQKTGTGTGAGIQPAPQAPARQDEPPQLSLVGAPSTPPDCPHLEVLALWAEVLPAMPQHDPTRWRGAKADHLRVRWKETAVAKSWLTREQGLAYFRKLFAYVGQSAFLTGRSKQIDPNKRPFVIELEWLVVLSNWDKVHEGKYHPEAA